MKEEEVDQYFKNKFSQYTPAPSADAWARLQSKMEPPQQKRPVMWVYYAAAVVTVLFMSGALFLWMRNNEVPQNGSLARQTPVIKPLPAPATQPIIADLGNKADNAALKNVPGNWQNEPNAKTQNTINTNATGKPVKKVKKIRPGILIAATPNQINVSAKMRPVPATKNPTMTSVTEPMPTLADAAPPKEGEIMEVVIKKDSNDNIMLAQANEKEFATPTEAIRDNLTRKGKLVKNIFKQARNLKNGEKVELSTLGINANYRIDVESKILKHKYSKVINL